MSCATVLLTGSSGFVALHVLDHLLKSGFSVVAAVRNEARAKDVAGVVQKLHHDSSKVAYTYITDMAVEDAYDDTFKTHKEITRVVHTASPFALKVNDYQRDLLDPAIKGTINLLYAIKMYAPQVTHVVVTSSIVAMLNFVGKLDSSNVFTEKDFNPSTIEDAKTNDSIAYGVSKTRAEQAFWKFISEEKPNFVGTTVNPSYVFGPVLGKVSSPARLNESSGYVWKCIFTDTIPQDGKYWAVDVRDVAAAHVLALNQPSLSTGKRWCIRPIRYTVKELVELAANTKIEAYRGKVRRPDASVNSAAVLADFANIDSSATDRDLNGTLKFHSLAETIEDSLQSYNDLGLTI